MKLIFSTNFLIIGIERVEIEGNDLFTSSNHKMYASTLIYLLKSSGQDEWIPYCAKRYVQGHAITLYWCKETINEVADPRNSTLRWSIKIVKIWR